MDRPSILGLIAAVLSGAVPFLYLGLIAGGAVGVQGDEARVAIVVGVLSALPACAVVGSFRSRSNAGIALLGVAAVGLLVFGGLALFSIGLPLIVASVFAWAALVRAALTRWRRPA